MPTFLAYIANRAPTSVGALQLPQAKIEQHLRCLATRLQASYGPLNVHSRCVNELGCVFGWLEPIEKSHLQRIVHRQSADGLLVAWLRELGPTPVDVTALWQAWQSGGAEALHQTDADFAALVVEPGTLDDRASCRAHLLGDFFGRRALSYRVEPDGVWVTPHELAIVSVADRQLAPDLTSVASVAINDASIGNLSLFRGVARVDAHEVLTFCAGRTQRRRVTRLFANRVEMGDRQAILAINDQLFETASATAGAFAAKHEKLTFELTAGIDTRTALASFLPQGHLARRALVSRIEAMTEGGIGGTDGWVASKIARALGIEHRFVVPQSVGLSTFRAQAQILAWAMNGQTSAKRGLAPEESNDRPRVHAAAPAEFYRGMYYRRLDLFPWRFASGSDKVARGLLAIKASFRRYPWQVAIAEDFRERFVTAVSRFREGSTDMFDQLDSYYLFERFATWGAMPSRMEWNFRWSPFDAPALCRLALRLPAPIAKFSKLHARLLSQRLPELKWLPINGEALGAMYQGGLASLAVHGLMMPPLRTLTKLQRLGERSAPAPDLDQAVAQHFASTIVPALREEGLDRDAIALALLGEAWPQILDAHQQSGQHLDVIGNLLGLRFYFQLAAELRREQNAHVTRPSSAPAEATTWAAAGVEPA